MSESFLPVQAVFTLFPEGACIINISASRNRMRQSQTESYTAVKGGIAALTHAMAASFAGKVLVDSISPGWIDTGQKVMRIVIGGENG